MIISRFQAIKRGILRAALSQSISKKHRHNARCVWVFIWDREISVKKKRIANMFTITALLISTVLESEPFL